MGLVEGEDKWDLIKVENRDLGSRGSNELPNRTNSCPNV